MKQYIRPKNEALRFSLHDARILDFQFDYDSDTLTLVMDAGYVDIEKDAVVEGNVVIRGVSLEDSYVYLFDYRNVLCGNMGSFEGEKLTLESFLCAYPTRFRGFDLASEYDGYRAFGMSGMISRNSERPEEAEAIFDIYYQGDFVYEVRE